MSKASLCEKPESSERLLKAIAEQSGEGISLADAEGDFVFVNSLFCKMTGYGKTALLKMNVRDLVPPDAELSLFPKVMERRSESREAELMKKDGSRFRAEVKGCPVQLDDKKYVLGIVRDITRRRQAEEALLKEKKKLQDALAKIKQLRGLLPICSMCKKIRNDKGYWNRIETYVQECSEAESSHGICPDCAEDLYEDYYPQSNHSGEY